MQCRAGGRLYKRRFLSFAKKHNTAQTHAETLSQSSKICENTRHSMLFRPRVSTNAGKSSFRFSGSKIWEILPVNLKCVSNNIFKKEWKCKLNFSRIKLDCYCFASYTADLFYHRPLFSSAWWCPTRKLLLLWAPYTYQP